MESAHSSSSEEDPKDEDLDYVDDLASEEGEIPDDGLDEPQSEISLDAKISEALENEDFERAELLLNEKEKWCKSLKAELKKEKEKEEEERKRKLRTQMEQRFNQLKKTEEGLNKSLQDSKSNTPEGSPKQSRPK